MSEKRPGRELVKWVAVISAGFLAGYGWAYYWAVAQLGIVNQYMLIDEIRPAYYLSSSESSEPHDWLIPIFEPVHLLDRSLRPDFWDPEPTPDEGLVRDNSGGLYRSRFKSKNAPTSWWSALDPVRRQRDPWWIPLDDQ